MSRSNVQIATELRKDEALQTRKKILKCGGSVKNQDAVATQLANSDSLYLEKLEKLKKFSKDKKDIKKKLSQQTEWIQGGFYLRNYADRIEAEIPIIYQRLLVSMLQERDTVFAEVSELMDKNVESRKQNQSFAMLQIHEIKGMLNNVKKHYKNHTQDKSEEAENKRQLIASVLANVIVQMRNSHNDTWSSLCNEEQILCKELKEKVKAFSNIQTEFRHLSEDNRLDTELQIYDTDDDRVITLVEEWKQKIFDLEDEHVKSVEDIGKEKIAVHNEFCKNISSTDLDGSNNNNNTYNLAGWDESDHNVFVKVLKRAQVQGLSRQTLSTTLAAELPNKSSKQISSHENWYNSMQSINDRKKKVVLVYMNKREELMLQAISSVASLRVKVQEDAVAYEEQQRHEQARKEMHKQLNTQRLERMKDMESRLTEIERLKQQADEESKALEEKNKAERERKKFLIEQFKKDRDEVLAAQRLKRESDLKLLEEEKRQQMLAAKPLIEQREALLKNKEEEKKRKQQLLLEEEARRVDILNRLAEQVPYWDALQNASSKLDHVTASVESHRYFKPEEPSRGFHALNGFTDKRVFKDARFRLGLALREAGVHHSAAAHALVAAMNPRSQAPW